MIKYLKRVHKTFISEGFNFDDEDNAIPIKILYFFLLLGFICLGSFLGLEIANSITDNIYNFFIFVFGNKFGEVLNILSGIAYVSGFCFSLYFIYILIKCMFIK